MRFFIPSPTPVSRNGLMHACRHAYVCCWEGLVVLLHERVDPVFSRSGGQYYPSGSLWSCYWREFQLNPPHFMIPTLPFLPSPPSPPPPGGENPRPLPCCPWLVRGLYISHDQEWPLHLASTWTRINSSSWTCMRSSARRSRRPSAWPERSQLLQILPSLTVRQFFSLLFLRLWADQSALFRITIVFKKTSHLLIVLFRGRRFIDVNTTASKN